MMGTYQILCLILIRSKTRFKNLLMPPRFSSLYTRIKAAMSGQKSPTITFIGSLDAPPKGIAGSPIEKCSARGPSSQNRRERAKTNTKNCRGDLFNDVLVFMTCSLLDVNFNN